MSSLPNGQKHEQQPHSPLQPEPQPIRSPHEQLVSFLPAAATTMSSINQTPAPSIATRPRQQAPPQTTCMVTSGPRPDMGKMHVVSPRDIATTKQLSGFPLPGALPQTAFATHMHRVVPASHAATIPTSLLQNLHHGHKPIHHLSGPDHAKRFAQIQDTFNTLSKSPPFRVRFSKDHSLIGRVIAFDAFRRGYDFELKVVIEYPIGSKTVFKSASGAGRQMYREFRVRLGMGGGFRGASCNGYKDLEFERINCDEDWRVLGELLTEEVRFFRGSVKKDLPTPFLDPKFPNLPPATLNATLNNILLNQRKHASSSEDNVDGSEARKERKVDIGSNSDEEGRHRSHSPKSPHSPSSGQSSPNLVNGNGYAAAHSPRNNGSARTTATFSGSNRRKESTSPVCSLPNDEAASPTGTQSRTSPLPAPDTSFSHAVLTVPQDT